MNNAPLLATLGVKGNPAPAGLPEGTLGDALATDDRALDAALEFASLLLQSADTGDSLPEAGNGLPVTTTETIDTEIVEDAALIAEEIAADEALELAVPITAPATPADERVVAQMGQQVAGDIRRAKAAAIEKAPAMLTPIEKPQATTQPVVVPPVPTTLPVVNAPISTTPSLPLERDIISKLGATDRGFALTQDLQSTSAPLLRTATTLPGNLQESAALAPRSVTVNVPMGDQDWGRQFSERVGWVIHARVPNAQVRLNPEHLGPIEMSIEVEDNNARVQFVAAHGMTREAIEQTLPRLREMLEQQGLNLQQADVGAEGGKTSDGGEETLADDAAPAVEGKVSEQQDDSLDASKTVISHGVGLIDTFV